MIIVGAQVSMDGVMQAPGAPTGRVSYPALTSCPLMTFRNASP